MKGTSEITHSLTRSHKGRSALKSQLGLSIILKISSNSCNFSYKVDTANCFSNNPTISKWTLHIYSHSLRIQDRQRQDWKCLHGANGWKNFQILCVHNSLCLKDFKPLHLQSVKTYLNKQQPEASQRSANSQSKITAAPSMCHINVGMLIVYL